MRIERLFSLAAAVSICSLAPYVASAQITAGVTGTVHDASGAVIPNAKVAVFNKDRGINRESVSNSSGDYLVQGLGEGTYSVKVTAKGFQSFLAENQVMRVGQNIRVDATLSVGSSTTEVTVQGSSAGTVETQSSELSTPITSKQISQLELNGRSFTQLIELSPGVSNQTGSTDPVQGPGQGVSYSVNGGRTEYNNWEIDGGDVLDSGSMSNLNVLPTSTHSTRYRYLLPAMTRSTVAAARAPLRLSRNLVRTSSMVNCLSFCAISCSTRRTTSILLANGLARIKNMTLVARWAAPSSRTSYSSSTQKSCAGRMCRASTAHRYPQLQSGQAITVRFAPPRALSSTAAPRSIRIAPPLWMTPHRTAA